MKQKKAKPLIHFLKKRPKGEDFFVANVILPTRDDPCWKGGFTVIGKWKHVCVAIRDFFDSTRCWPAEAMSESKNSVHRLAMLGPAIPAAMKSKR
jgi:hypothetical protein